MQSSPSKECPATTGVTGTSEALDTANMPDKVDGNSAKVERRQTKNGRRYVRIHGSKEEAQEARGEIERGGEKVGPLNADKYNRGAWYFYLD